jgi:hypothetical protein
MRSGSGRAAAPCLACAGKRIGVKVIAVITVIAILAPSLPGQASRRVADIWLAGDVNLGDGGGKQLKNIALMVQGSEGIVNLERSRAG